MARTPKIPNGTEPTAPTSAPLATERPQPATWLTDNGRTHFATLVSRLEKLGGASQTHEEALNLCADALATVQQLSEILGTEGLTYKTVSDAGFPIVKERPEFRQKTAMARIAMGFLQQLGLTPASSKHQRARPKPTKAGDFDEFG